MSNKHKPIDQAEPAGEELANAGAAGVPPVEEAGESEGPRKLAFSKKLDEILRSGESNTTKRDQILKLFGVGA